MSKNAVIYHYFEADVIYKENLIYFLTSGICDNIDYYIIITDECSIDLPKKTNITYINTKNWNNDFGGYIEYIKNHYSEGYDNYIFVNSSVRGPFLPSYVEQDWTDIFTSRLHDDVHLVGASINVLPATAPYAKRFEELYKFSPPFAHVQTTSYALTAEAIKHLISIGFYDVDQELSKLDVILAYELRMSQELISNGWNISSLLPVYGEIDYRNMAMPHENFTEKNGDTLYRGAFFGRTLSPTDLVFIKTNRNMISQIDLASYTFTGLSRFAKDIDGFDEGRSLLLKSYQEAKQLTHMMQINSFSYGISN